MDFQPSKIAMVLSKNITSSSEIITILAWRILLEQNSPGIKRFNSSGRRERRFGNNTGVASKSFAGTAQRKILLGKSKDVARYECELQSGIRIESSHTHRRSCIHFYEVCSRLCSRTRTCRRGVRSRAARRAIRARIFLKHDRETGTWVSYACRGNSRWREMANKGRNIGIDGGDELQTQLFARSPFSPLIAYLHNTIFERIP